jgi:nitrate/nitrite-specific signal transduction histidine kinase
MNFKYNEMGKQEMKLAIGIIGIALVLTCAANCVSAQTEGSTEKAATTNSERMPQTYRLTYTIAESDGSKRLGTQHFAITVNPDTKDAEVKLGSRVPIVTGSYNTASPTTAANVEFQYLDVGLNIAARVREFSAGVEVYSKLEQSSVAEEKSTVGSNDPVIRQATVQNTAMLTPGKPVMLGSLDVPGSTRHLDIEVVLEIVK